jgi:hypothetical protein
LEISFDGNDLKEGTANRELSSPWTNNSRSNVSLTRPPPSLATFLCLVLAGTRIFPPKTSLVAYVGYIIALSIILLIVCWKKGEPPRWRWGDPD